MVYLRPPCVWLLDFYYQQAMIGAPVTNQIHYYLHVTQRMPISHRATGKC